MLTGHRYRVIIYFAALVLCLSVCFAFAEEPASLDHYATSAITGRAAAASTLSSNTESIHVLYYSAPGRASFLSTLPGRLIVEKAEPTVQVASADALLKQLGAQSDRHRSLHSLFPGKHRLKLIKTYSQQQQLPAPNTAQASEPVDAND